MKTRWLFLSFVFCSVAFGQTEQKNMLVGGGLDVSYLKQDSFFTFSIIINPKAGIFVYKNLLIGANVGIGLSSDNRAKKRASRLFLNTSVSPFVRYYFLKEKMRPFLFASAGYVGSTSIIKGNSSNIDGFTYSGGMGFCYFPNKNVGVECTLGYTGTKFQERSLQSRISFGIGLQYFFLPRFFKKELKQ